MINMRYEYYNNTKIKDNKTGNLLGLNNVISLLNEYKNELNNCQKLFDAMNKTLSVSYKNNNEYRKINKGLYKFLILNNLEYKYKKWLNEN